MVREFDEELAQEAPFGGLQGGEEVFVVAIGDFGQPGDRAAAGDVQAMTDLMRIEASQSTAAGRVSDLAAKGFFSSAARAQARAERAAQAAAARSNQTNLMSQLFSGARNMGESVRNMAEEARRAGMGTDEALARMGINRRVGQSTESAIRDFLKGQGMTEAERQRQAEQAAAGVGGKSAAAPSDKLATEGTLVKILNNIQERPILVA